MDAAWIDLHHHFVAPLYIDEVGSAVPLDMRRWSVEQSLEDMDRFGVSTAILSVTVPGFWFGDAAQSRRLARACNEYAAGLSVQYPGRFGFFAAVPIGDTEGSLREIEYALDVLHADGIGLYTSYESRWLGHPTFVPIFEELNRRKAVVYVHPTTPACCGGLLPEIRSAIIEYGTDTTRAIADFVFSGTASRFQDLRVIFSHAGGTMPFLIGRFMTLSREAPFSERLPRGLLHELRRFFYDTAQAANRGAMSSLLSTIPLSQVVFGTDFPYRSAGIYRTGLLEAGFAPEELFKIGRTNALGLLAMQNGRAS